MGVCPSGTHTPQPNEEPWAPNVAKPTGPSISRVGGQRQGRSHSSPGEGRGAATGGAGKGWGSPSRPGRATSPRGPIYMELKVTVTLKGGHEVTHPGGQPSGTQVRADGCQAHLPEPTLPPVKGPAHLRGHQGGDSSWRLQPVPQSPDPRPDLRGGGMCVGVELLPTTTPYTPAVAPQGLSLTHYILKR